VPVRRRAKFASHLVIHTVSSNLFMPPAASRHPSARVLSRAVRFAAPSNFGASGLARQPRVRLGRLRGLLDSEVAYK
jgi:hypothetical protein